MLKLIETFSTPRPAHILLGAAMLIGIGSPALAQQNRVCQVAFNVTNATTLRSLQFEINYNGAAAVGDFVTPSECTFAPAGFGDVGVNQTTNIATSAWANITPPFAGNGLFLTCRYDIPLSASAVPALADFVIQNIEGESSAGVPASPAPTIAASSISCIEAGACSLTPESGCAHSTVAGKSTLSFKDNAVDAKDQGQYQWKSGALTDVSDFNSPTTAGKTVSWCVYKNGALADGVSVPSAGTCGSKPCWKAAGTTGFLFKGDVDGVSQIKLKAGAAGKAQVLVKGKSKVGNYTSPVLPFAAPVTSQFVIDDGVTLKCFESTFTTPKKDVIGQYSSKD